MIDNKKFGELWDSFAGTSVVCCLLFVFLAAGCNPPDAGTVPKAAPAKPKIDPNQPNRTKRKTQEVVDAVKLMAERPDMFVADNKIDSKNPLGIARDAYFSAMSDVNVLNFQRQLDLLRTMEDRILTYKDVMEFIKKENFTFNELLPYQFYAYDEMTGKFFILEDPQKREEYEQQ